MRIAIWKSGRKLRLQIVRKGDKNYVNHNQGETERKNAEYKEKTNMEQRLESTIDYFGHGWIFRTYICDKKTRAEFKVMLTLNVKSKFNRETAVESGMNKNRIT
ncbi:MAG: hypothetical protein IKO10_04660 [Lachnospiraceae bacterium]|nr:hypothetical protein [Lachnospiraceae bacterium]